MFYSVFTYETRIHVGRDSSVGMATRYSLEGPGSNPGGGVRFFAPVQTGPGAHPASYTMGSFPGVKWPGRGVVHPLPYSTEAKERVELYIYPPLLPLWPVLYGELYLTLPVIHSGHLSIHVSLLARLAVYQRQRCLCGGGE